MAVKNIGLCWIVVKDVKAAIKFYTEVVGLKLMEFDDRYGWAELEGHQGGSRLGIAQQSEHEKVLPGQNAIMTFTVDNLDKEVGEMVKKGAQREGEVCEITGHVRMQMIVDRDGNRFQICELMHHSCPHC